MATVSEALNPAPPPLTVASSSAEPSENTISVARETRDRLPMLLS